MSVENRLSIIDGSVEEVRFGQADSSLLRSNSFTGAVVKRVKRLSLIDGTVEEVKMVVLPPIKGEKANE